MRKIILFFSAIAIGFILLFGSGLVVGQTTLNFDTAENWIQDGTNSFTSYAAHAYSESGVTILGTEVIRNTTTDQDGFPGALGTYSMRLRNTTAGKALITIASGGVSTFSIKVRRWDGSPLPNYTLKYSTDGGSIWTSLTNIDGTLLATSDWFTYNGTINSAAANILIDIANTGTTERIMIDDFSWTGFSSSTPTITVSPSTLTGFSYFVGSGPSAEQSFTISGADLTDDISIAASTNYEISETSGSGYTTPIILTQSSGTVGSTTIYTRLKAGLDAGSYINEVITATSTDAADKTVTCSGSVITPSPVIINEVDADTEGTDVLEFIELYDGGAGNTSLDGLVLVLYNGSDDLSYASYDLDGKTTDANGYFVVGNSGVTNVGLVFNNGTLQNGPDAVALYYGDATDFLNGTSVTVANIIDAFVYDTDDADDPGLLVLLNASEPQINENGRGNKDYQSSQRFPNGTGGARNTSTYDQTYPTPGAANKGNATWTGIASNDWETIGNWANIGPTVDHDVYIPTGISNYPTISSSANCNNILIEDGASLIGAEFLTVGGTATMQRSIPEYTTTANGWHLLSSPVNNMAIAVSDFAPGADDDFYAWDELTYTWLNYKVPANNIINFVNGTGYIVAYQTTATKDFVGTFNSANISFTNLSKTIAGNGWHLLGNPFQSAVQLTSDWAMENIIGNGVKVMNDGGSYSDISDGGFIPANQGFFVQVSVDASNSITIPISQRVHSSTPFYKSEPVNVLTLKASDGDFYVETSIQIMAGATLGFDAPYDMNFLAGIQNAPYLYSAISETEKLSTNRIAPIEQLTEVPLAFKSFLDKEFTLSTTNANSFDSDIEVYLMDKVADKLINLKETPEYTFIATAGELTDRFVVQLFKVGTGTQDSKLQGVQIYSNGEQIYLQSNSDNKALVRVFNMLGQEVYNKTMVIGGLQSIDIKQKAGWYIVQLAGEQGIVREKVFIR